MRLLTFFSFLILSCSNNDVSYDEIPMEWNPMDRVNSQLSQGITLYEGQNKTIPIKAWYAHIQRPDSLLSVRILASDDMDLRETPSQFASRTGAELVINGGYFRMNKLPTNHVGLLYINHSMIEPPPETLIRWNRRYRTARGALGIMENGKPDIAWAHSRNDSLFEWKAPTPNRPQKPIRKLDFTKAIHWPVMDAIHAGPVLIHNGNISIASDEEIFFGTQIPKIHPRTAVGIKKNGDLILCIIDGRQLESRGVDLNELARIMFDLGCIEAINLDGGGSSALVVNGHLLNRPAGLTTEREVMSALAVFQR